eukprot:Hpha_TRINITY_DN15613_c0_g3::TRINITY_DN15613_c0_g3_i1::g.100083::m.100083
MPPAAGSRSTTEGFSNREVFLSLLKTVTILAVLLCLAANIVAMDNAMTHKWFDLCDSKCAVMGGRETGGVCDTCCQKGCTLRKKAFFYILRLYSMCFCILSVVAALPSQTGPCTFRWTWRYFRGIKGFVGRGLLQVFVGMQTVEANFFNDGSSSEQFADAVGYTVLALGAVHVLLGIACFTEEAPDFSETEGRAQGTGNFSEMSPASPQQPPATQSVKGPPAPPAGPAKTETAFERMQRERREADEALERDRRAMESGSYTDPSRRDKDDALASRYYAPKPAAPAPPPEPAAAAAPAAAGGKPLPPIPPAQPPAAAPAAKDVDDDIAKRRAADDDELERRYYSGR